MNHLDFEKPIAELEEKIAELQRVSRGGNLNLESEIENLRTRSRALSSEIFTNLDAWQITQLARHPQRPYTNDYIARIIDDFQELHGDRLYADDAAMVTGLGYIDGQPIAVIGQQKGRDMETRRRMNFGMPRPEGYRKAQRVMKLAARFALPVITLIDTPGAFPGVGAEERGQSQAIAASLELMATLPTPIIAVIIGEGGSGGALAIGVCDHLIMLQYATYSVISPEGCASILWKSAENAPQAAAAMGVTAEQLYKHKLVDEVLDEPLGGAHRDYDAAAAKIKTALLNALDNLQELARDELLAKRYTKLTEVGAFAVRD